MEMQKFSREKLVDTEEKIAYIENIIFVNKQNISRNQVYDIVNIKKEASKPLES